MKTRMIGLAAVVMTGGIFLAVGEMRRSRATAEWQRQRLAERARVLEQEIHRAQQQLRALRDESASLQTVLTKTPTREKKEASKATKGIPSAAEFAEMVTRWHEEQKTPEGQRRELVWRTERLAESFAPLIESLGLTADQAERFRESAFRRAEQQMDVLAVAEAHGLTLMDPSIGAIWNKNEQDYQNEQRALLGPEGYEKFREYGRTVDIRNTVRSFVGATTLAGHPLTAAQGEELVRIFADTTPDYRKGGTARGLTVDWEAGIEKARAVVSPEQLQVILSHETPGGQGGLAWAKFNRLLQEARDADRPSMKVKPGDSSR